MKIRLETVGGDLVHESQIPPFKEEPDVIQWGNRTFLDARLGSADAVKDAEDSDVTVYRECFAYALTDNPHT